MIKENPTIWYKSLRIVFSFVGREQGVALVEEYDRKSLYPKLLKCHEHLHPLVRSEKNYVNWDFLKSRLEVGYVWTNCKHKWISKITC